MTSWQCETCGRKDQQSSNKKQCYGCYWHTKPNTLETVKPDKRVMFTNRNPQ